MRTTAALLRSEAKMILREPSDLVIPIGLPLLMLVVTGLINQNTTILGGVQTVVESIALPTAFVTTLALVAVINVPSRVSSYRTGGVLRRLSVTPISPARILGAQVAVSAVQAIVGLTIAWLVGASVFDVSLPENPALTLGVIALTAAAFYALGMVIASLSPSPSVTVAIGFVVFFGLGALGGMFDGGQALPERLIEIGSWLPYGAGADAIGAAWTGQQVELRSILSLSGFVVGGTAVSLATFRWDR